MRPHRTPDATYRLQFNRDFTFVDASRFTAYLHRLGISHVYASPFFKSRAGSPHGYDIVDHNVLNPEIGNEDSFAAWVSELRGRNMGLLLDIVPNHMGVGGDDNEMWLDVLEHGEASVFARWFEIDWRPANRFLRGKVLLPFLGDHYGVVLENGDLQLVFDVDQGSFAVRYFEHLFPIDPRTYPRVLAFAAGLLDTNAGDHVSAFRTLIDDFRHLPRRTEFSGKKREQRRRGASACKGRLAELCRDYPPVHTLIEENISRLNGLPGEPASFDPLHDLLEAQAWRLSYWKVAADEINYRRFFDINDLAAIRVDDDEVFASTHRLVKRLMNDGQIDGLRVDHPDGLSYPLKYLSDLHKLADGDRQDSGAVYLLVEKILMEYERLPEDWPVDGTTGYDAGRVINGLFVDMASEGRLTQLYHRFTGQAVDFDELLYERKKLIIRTVLSSELTMLANLVMQIAQADRHTRDFTHQGLRYALGEVAACYPVYRTYIVAGKVTDEDRNYVRWAVSGARKRSPANDALMFEFIHELLVNADHGALSRHRIEGFIRRFQQYTAPVMAKGLEDTTAYVYNRLISLNEVGGAPATFGVPLSAFHHVNRQRQALWPRAMVSTSTHDSKRSEDVRARINVISELPDEWRRRVARWSRMNRRKKKLVSNEMAPSRNDEYLLYQTLLGVWPLAQPVGEELIEFRDRIEAYMLKAVREAKLRTSWINPNEEYEAAVREFVQALLSDSSRNAFLADFISFQQRIAHFGLLNSLSQTLLKLTVPGVPDIYQGTELWAFHLVDPDNRKPVDFQVRQEVLETLAARIEAGEDLVELVRELMDRIEDGHIKLYLILQTLALRKREPQLFISGDYVPLNVEGPNADHVCAFERRLGACRVVVVACRWFARLEANPGWEHTWIEAPSVEESIAWRDVLTGERIHMVERADGGFFHAADLLRHINVALVCGS
ncbi:MAG: malto-oligosyltrehalose synthase [Pseudomonadales bacterium]